MGDLQGIRIEENLVFIPKAEFDRVQKAIPDPIQGVSLFADMCRLNTLYMIAKAGSGHIGSSFSALDIASWVLTQEKDDSSLFFSSKGHDAPGLYSALIALGTIDFEMLHRLRQFDGLPGHPDVSTPGIVTNTGSLGMGISKAKGMIRAGRLSKHPIHCTVMTGDGELQEGQIWESLASAAHEQMGELVVIVDHNKVQSDTLVSNVNDLGNVEEKFRSFGWVTARCPGHDLRALQSALNSFKSHKDKPKLLVADTVKGKGVSFMEHTNVNFNERLYPFHSGAPSPSDYEKGSSEILDRIDRALAAQKLPPLSVAHVEKPVKTANPSATSPQSLVKAYSRSLVQLAEKHPRLVVLDADLVLDTGLVSFRKAFPDRFIECGIAEQDMVSQAGGLALKGMLPVVHSFAGFLTARANEQIYNNATEKTKVIYVGSLAGVVPAAPGHSHQSVRDIALLSSIPGLVLIEPSTEAEVEWALRVGTETLSESVYLRLVSVPWPVPYTTPRDLNLRVGQGYSLTEGDDVLLFAYGPVLLSEAYLAADRLRTQHNVGVRVINFPWLNRIDLDWLKGTLKGYTRVVTMDNHYTTGGFGDQWVRALTQAAPGTPFQVKQLGLESLPRCGKNEDVLKFHHLDSDAIVNTVLMMMEVEV